MKALKIILTALLIIILLLAAIAFFLPSSVTIEKQQEIKSPVNIVYYQVDNLKNWSNWSPFQADDMVNSFEGPSYGPGAMRFWESAEMGSGKMTIKEDNPFNSVITSVEIFGQGSGEGNWTFEKTEDGTMVTWSYTMLDLKYPIGRLFGLMANGMMSPIFEKGLTQLKDYCESLPDFSNIEEVDLEMQAIVSYTDSCTINTMGEKMGQMYGMLREYMAKEAIEMAGAPIVIYHQWNPQGTIIMEAGLPVAAVVPGTESIESYEIKACKAIKGVLIGDYSGLGDVHNAIDAYAKACGHSVIAAPWEQYLSDPMTEPDTAMWLTNVYYPIKY